MSTLGERLRAERIALKKTQEDIANCVNKKTKSFSRSALTLAESGSTKGLKPENLIAIAECLGLKAKWIATGIGEKYHTTESGAITTGSDDKSPEPAYSKRVKHIADYLADNETELNDLITGVIKTINKIQARAEITELDNVNHHIVHNSNSHKS